MRIGGYDKLSTVDYPGEMACAIFLVGCNFNCGYCHNPSLISGNNITSYVPKEEVMEYLKLSLFLHKTQ
jgi:pyruvate formate lyase activating enzyme